MSPASSVLKALSAEWAAIGSCRQARAALDRWSSDHPALSEFGSPADIVEFCHGSPSGDANLALATLIEVADPLAVRTVLQALLPGLAAMSRRGRRRWPWMFDIRSDGPWAEWGFDNDAVAIAHGQIRALASDPPRWPATTVLDRTWRRLRIIEAQFRRDHAAACQAAWGLEATGPLVEVAPTEELDLRPAVEVNTPAAELAVLLREAVRSGSLGSSAAALVFETSVVGRSCAEIARRSGASERLLRYRRDRAECQLVTIAGAA